MKKKTPTESTKKSEPQVTNPDLRDPKAIHEYYRKIISCMPNNVYWLDRNCVTQGCNDNVLKLVGLKSLDEFIGITYEQMGEMAGWTEGQAESFKRDDMDVMSTGIAKLNVEEPALYDDQGNPVYYISSRVPIFNEKNEVVGVIGISVDITARKKMEEDLRKAKEAAEMASRAKTMFLANMSHDIKTPIAGIISTAEYLTHSIENSDDRSRSEDIVKSGFRLLELMIEIIEISRLEVRQTERAQHRFSIKKLIEDIVQLIKPAFIEKPFKLKVEYGKKIPKFIIGDRWHLYRVILNLLSNAIKFTKEGSITIRVEPVKQSKKQITLKISVEDTGMGIPKEKQAMIFDEFTRITPSYEGIYKGTGLGLYIVKQFIEAMQGKITVESEESKGSKFSIIIPFKKPLSQKAEPTEKLVSTSKPSEALSLVNLPGVSSAKEVKVLLVEDNFIASRAAKSTLEALGCQVDTAYTGNEALKLFDANQYNLIYMDLGLPDMEGTEVAKQIRQMETDGKKKSVIIALSAHVDEQVKSYCLFAGMNEVANKPLLRDQVIQVLKRAGIKKFNLNHKNGSKKSNVKLNKKIGVIDLKLGATIIGSNIDDAKHAIEMLANTLPENQKAIQEAYHLKDKEALIKAIHKLHGGITYCGVPRLKVAVKELETGIRSDMSKDNIEKLYQNMCNEINLFFDAYKKEIIST